MIVLYIAAAVFGYIFTCIIACKVMYALKWESQDGPPLELVSSIWPLILLFWVLLGWPFLAMLWVVNAPAKLRVKRTKTVSEVK